MTQFRWLLAMVEEPEDQQERVFKGPLQLVNERLAVNLGSIDVIGAYDTIQAASNNLTCLFVTKGRPQLQVVSPTDAA